MNKILKTSVFLHTTFWTLLLAIGYGGLVLSLSACGTRPVVAAEVTPTPTKAPTPTAQNFLERDPHEPVDSSSLLPTTLAQIVLTPMATYTPTEIPGDPYLLVDVSEQKMYAYKGEVLVNEFVVSTGDLLHPTLLGEFDIYNKYEKIDIIGIDKVTGEDYYYHDVQYVMQFWGAFYIHSVYWHDDFGTAVSNGCVNMRVEDAHWVFDFAPLGTKLKVQR